MAPQLCKRVVNTIKEVETSLLIQLFDEYQKIYKFPEMGEFLVPAQTMDTRLPSQGWIPGSLNLGMRLRE